MSNNSASTSTSTSTSNANRSNSNNRHRRSNSKNFSTGKRSHSIDNANKLSHQEQVIASQNQSDRTLFLLANSIGSKCIVTVSSGSRYIGLLYTTSDLNSKNNEISVVLKLPEIFHIARGDELDPNEELPETLIIEYKDLVDLEVLDLDLSSKALASAAVESPVAVTGTTGTTASIGSINSSTGTDTSGNFSPSSTNAATSNLPSAKHSKSFRTDSDISSDNAIIRERELLKWVPEEDSSSTTFGGLEDETLKNSNSSSWDQFAVNEKKFGITSSFDEELYTTKISKDSPEYQQRLKIAEKIAKEIESSSYNGNIHLAEERGIVVDDSGIDEEDKYSGVDRRSDELMAALRGNGVSNDNIKKIINNTFGNGTSTTSTTTDVNNITSASGSSGSGKYVPPRQRAAHYHNDPAILSSSAISQNRQGSTTVGTSVSSPSSSSSNANKPSPITVTRNSADNSTEKSQGVNQSVADSNANANTNINSNSENSKQAETLSEKAKAVSVTPKLPPTLPHKPQTKKTHFRNETSRINAQSEINSLKEFSVNFRIPSKFPEDLLSIVTKDRIKQEQIIKKAEEASKSAKSSPALSKVSTTTESTSAAPTTTASTATPSKSAAGAKKASTVPEKPVSSASASTPSVVPATSTKSGNGNTNTSASTGSVYTKKKMDPRSASTFKMNPNSSSFSPSNLPLPPATSHRNSIYNKNSPSHQSQSSRGNSVSGGKRNQNATPYNFFGSRVPKADQRTGNDFTIHFNLFLDLRRNKISLKDKDDNENREQEKDAEKVDKKEIDESSFFSLLDKPFVTVPTWISTTDESFRNLFSTLPEKVGLSSRPMFYPPPPSSTGSANSSNGSNNPSIPTPQAMTSPIPVPSPMMPTMIPLMIPPQGFENAGMAGSPQGGYIPPHGQFIPGGYPVGNGYFPQAQIPYPQQQASNGHHYNNSHNNSHHPQHNNSMHHGNNSHHNNNSNNNGRNGGFSPMLGIPFQPPQNAPYGRMPPQGYPGTYYMPPPSRQF
ncbi:hypothetical protein PACTADRAFT_49039 [Pachysolen tannophilus NRRL Y-2460]|uniref:LsmAD domain-containing protein n=1 Tax=Pachysolen tannophilus NRRL Y-2460 TaxID=669874 RepID=A0A1E4TZY0_PACTA|nr:hypothetical protein PACTADRAFT_49039 [Pachysolen tannophilus NRRL Y-2460]